VRLGCSVKCNIRLNLGESKWELTEIREEEETGNELCIPK